MSSAGKINEAKALALEADAGGVALRFLGGVAIAIHSGREETPHRDFSDLDAVTKRKHVRALMKILDDRGYEPETRFNALNGSTRLIFHGPEGKLDIFVDAFEMCHRLVFAERLALDTPTLTVTDLLLTKLQVVESNDKDLLDLRLLLSTHGLAEGEGDHVNLDYLRRLLGQDWGLWRTVTGSLADLARAADLADKVSQLQTAVERGPRTLSFRLRAKVGENKRWYDLPEETGGE